MLYDKQMSLEASVDLTLIAWYYLFLHQDSLLHYKLRRYFFRELPDFISVFGAHRHLVNLQVGIIANLVMLLELEMREMELIGTPDSRYIKHV